LARAITIVENSEAGVNEILTAVQPHGGNATIVGITGPPGAGKSTLINALISELRSRQKTICVLAVDPSSPLSGGAILGDRIRMEHHATDPGVFIRSLATRGHLGGLSRTACGVIQVMDAFDPHFIIVETVGAGQSEVEVANLSHGTVVVCPPGLGDDVQAIKAGILEIATILVVNKCDYPESRDTVRHLEGMLDLRRRDMKYPPIIQSIATTGQGVSELADALEALALSPRDPQHADQRMRLRRSITQAAVMLMHSHIQSATIEVLDPICDHVQAGEISLGAAAAELLQTLNFSDVREQRLFPTAGE